MYYREKILKWWSNLRWFMILVVMCVGTLELLHNSGAYQPLVYLGVFGGLVALNLYFHLQKGGESQFAIIIQIVLDIVFATLSVHLTGGPGSYFSWLYLIPVITASLLIPRTGGVTTGLIGTFSLLGLIASYRLGWLESPTGSWEDFGTIYLLSYSGLFCVIGFIVNYLNDLTVNAGIDKHESEKEKVLVSERLDKVSEENKNMNKLCEAVKDIVWIDRDINTQLCVVSLSLKRIKKAAAEFENDDLARSSNEIADSVNKMIAILESMESFRQKSAITSEE
ncbi:MAG: hypothetical protein K9M99_01900 [Candidatus Cloacimonetes bacterium]|nr:hypothetical protein [Candidatus Cloacimonadota bacterium]